MVVVTAILDLDGNVHVATGWQPICTQFHRNNNETKKRCTESDTILAGKLKKGNKYNIYKCKNGLIDVAMPIIVGDIHVGNFFTGQFLDKKPDIEYFRKQAQTFGFDEKKYLNALKNTPIFTEKEIENTIQFLVQLTEVIGNIGLANLKNIENTKQLEADKELIRKAREKAEISEKYYHTILDKMGDPVFVKDEQSRFLLVNDAFCETMGLNRNEIINKTLAESSPADEMEHFLKVDKIVLTNGIENTCEEPLTVKSGHTLTVSTRKTRFIDNDGNKFLIGVIRDITKRKATENKLIESEEKYRTITETIPGAVYECDMDWTFLFLSPGFKELTGYPFSDIINNKVRSYASLMYEDDIKRITHSLDEAVKKKDLFYFSEYKLKTKSRKIKWVHDSVRILYDKGGKVTGYKGILMNYPAASNGVSKPSRGGLIVLPYAIPCTLFQHLDP